jgi:superoxide dismutase, Cu-Zn family
MKRALIAVFCVSAAAVCQGQGRSPGDPAAGRYVAILNPTQDSQASGEVEFIPRDNHVEVRGRITGLSPGTRHGIHIHEVGDCSAPDAKSAGDHYNPAGLEHGSPDAARRHAGDLGNLQADSDGVATLDLQDPVLSSVGVESLVGRSVVVHANPDDFTSQPSGNSGDRLACGVIGRRP